MKSKLTIAEASQELAISPVATWRLVKSGKLPAIRYPGMRKLLIRRADLDAFVDASVLRVKGRRAA